LAIAVFVAWAASGGGFPEDSLYPGALFITGLTIATLLAVRGGLRERIPRATLIAAALLAAFALWSFASIGWADVKGDAWEGANHALIYLTVFVLFAAIPWTSRTAATVFGAYGLAMGAVALVVVLKAAGSEDPTGQFIGGRLIDPSGYQNATAALFIGGLWPSLLLASRRETPWALRGLLLANAGLLVEVAVLPQSRGAGLVLPIALLIYVAIVPNRLRGLGAMALVAGAGALAAPRLLDVFDAFENGAPPGPALDSARNAILLSIVALFVVGTLLALLDRRYEASHRTYLVAARGTALAGAVAAVVAIVVALAAIGNVGDWADARWNDFKGGYDSSFQKSRFGGDLGSNRYDFWRVGLGTTFADSPLVGAGADNFAVDYLAERESDEEPLYPHSLEVRVLAGTGLIGALLLGGFFVAALVSAARGAGRRHSGLGRATAAGGIVAVAYVLGHSSGDWLWSFAAIIAPAFAWLAMAGAIRPDADEDPDSTGELAQDRTEQRPAVATDESGGRSRGAAIAGFALLGVTAAFALATYGMPWLASRYVEDAAESWPADPQAAFDELDRARSLNFLSAEADVTAGVIAIRLDDPDLVEQSFADALEREPDNTYVLLQLGTARGQNGDGAEARELIGRAHTLNPLDPTIALAAKRAGTKRALSFDEISEQLVERVCARVGQTGVSADCGSQ
jgi:hypothetical protein